MFKALLDYNSNQNVWLRDHRTSALVSGITSGIIIVVVTSLLSYRTEFKKQPKTSSEK